MQVARMRDLNEKAPFILVASLFFAILAINNPVAFIPILLLLLGFGYLKRLDTILYVVVIVSFTRIDAWLSLSSGFPLGSAMGALIVLSLLLSIAFTDLHLNAPNRSFVVLLAFYCSSFTIGILFGDTPYLSDWLRDTSYAFLTFSTVYLFCSERQRFEGVVKLIIFSGLILSIVNILEIIFPLHIQLSHSTGRAAGLLKNSNSSAFAIICSYILLNLHTRKLNNAAKVLVRLPAQIMLFIGVFATFSREGILLILLSTIASSIITSSNRRFAAINYLSLLLAILICAALSRSLLQSSNVTYYLSFKKIESFFHGVIDDNYRIYLADYYLDRFLENPLTGYGFNATLGCSLANADLTSIFGVKGPHNTPISIMTEFGFFPVLLYGLFFLSILLNIQNMGDKVGQRLLRLLLLNIIIHNLFAHDIPTTRFIMVLLGLLSAGPIVYRKNNAKLARSAAE